MDYKKINNEFTSAVNQTISDNQSQLKLERLKVFIDNSLSQILLNTTATQEERSKFLVSALFQVRDYLVSETTENSLKLTLIDAFKKIEEKIILEEEHQKKTDLENLTPMQKEPLGQDQST